MGGKKPLGRSQHAPVAVKMSVWGLRLSQAVSEHIRAIQKQQQQQTNTQNITKAHSLHYWAIPQAIDLTLKRETIFGFHLFSVGSSFGRKRPPSHHLPSACSTVCACTCLWQETWMAWKWQQLAQLPGFSLGCFLLRRLTKALPPVGCCGIVIHTQTVQ